MKKAISTLLAMVILISTITVQAKDIDNLYTVVDGSAETLIEVLQISEGHERVIYGNIIIDDIITSDYRKIITKCDSDISEYYEDLLSGIATLSVNGQIIETYDMNELRNNYTVWTMPEVDRLLLESALQDQISSAGSEFEMPEGLEEQYEILYDDGGIVIMPLEGKNYSTRAASTAVRPNGTVYDTFPEYTYKLVASQSRYSSVCQRNIDMKIKDSMHSYSQTSKQSYYYAAGTAVSVISGALKIASSTLTKSLSGLTTIVGGVLKLNASIDYYFKESFSFNALRQGWVYDYSYNNRDVSVYTESGSGEISLSWDFINNEYTNPAYKITGQAYPHTISYTTMYDETQRIWEFNMQQYGYWKWE